MGAEIGGIHQDLSQIEECMLPIQLGAERTGIVGEGFVFDFGTVLGMGDAPSAGVEERNGEEVSLVIPPMNPIDILGKVSNLIERVPDRQLEIVLFAARRDDEAHLD